MPRRGFDRCGICNSEDSKYSCPHCFTPYCSVTCYKEHKANSCADPGPTRTPPILAEKRTIAETRLQNAEEDIPDTPVLKPLSSLKWPYIPEEPSYSDPLERNKPKPLQLRHYQAIAMSPAIRAAISSSPILPPLLRKLDKLRGSEREEALEQLLGVTTARGGPHGQQSTSHALDSEEGKALKQLAEAVEMAIRGDKTDALGLDWEENH